MTILQNKYFYAYFAVKRKKTPMLRKEFNQVNEF